MNKNISQLLKFICVIIIFLNGYLFLANVANNNSVANEKISVFEYNYDYNNYIETDVLEMFDGQLTAYGSDCKGCSGITASGYDIRNGNITYMDEEYGEVRIVASDRKYSFGTIVRISNLKYYDEPFLAVVLDRGGAIKGNIMDLAFDSKFNPEVKLLGREKEAKFEILRKGW